MANDEPPVRPLLREHIARKRELDDVNAQAVRHENELTIVDDEVRRIRCRTAVSMSRESVGSGASAAMPERGNLLQVVEVLVQRPAQPLERGRETAADLESADRLRENTQRVSSNPATELVAALSLGIG